MIQRDRALNRYNNAVDKNNALVDNNEVIDNGSIGKLRRLFFYNGMLEKMVVIADRC